MKGKKGFLNIKTKKSALTNFVLKYKICIHKYTHTLTYPRPKHTHTLTNIHTGDVGALSEVREELLHNVLEPIAHPERFRSLGLEVPAGVLFFGPPG